MGYFIIARKTLMDIVKNLYIKIDLESDVTLITNLFTLWLYHFLFNNNVLPVKIN